MLKRRIKIAAVLCLAVILTASFRPIAEISAASSASVNAKKDEFAEIQKKIDSYNEALEEAKDAIEGALARKSKLDEQIELVETKIAATSELISEYDVEIKNKNAQIVEMDTEVDEKYESFKSWLRMVQVFGDVNYLDMILSADTFVDFLESVERMGTMIEYQNTVMDELRSDIADVGVERDAADALLAEQLEIKAAMEKDEAELLALRTESENYIAILKKNEKQYEQYISEAKAAEEELTAKIEADLKAIAEEQERKRREEEALKAQQNEAKPQENKNPTPVDDGKRPSFYWTVEGKFVVSSNFGICRGAYHRGIDIPAPLGTNVYAAASGTVSTAGYHSSFGKYVIITHDDGYATLYAHCSRLYVKNGQTVNGGDIIGAVGSTGYSFGNHLHFETYKNGALVDPLAFYEYMKDKYVVQIYNG